MANRHRIRSNQEIQGYVTSGIEAYEALRCLDIQPIVGGAALLGMKREGALMPWADGFVFTVKEEEVAGREKQIKRQLRNAGFSRHTGGSGRRYWKQDYSKRGAHIEIAGFVYCGEERAYVAKKGFLVLPSRFFEELTTFDFYWCEMVCPKDWEGYLTWCYGDWRTPVKPGETGAKQGHKNDQYFRTEYNHELLGPYLGNL